MYVSEGGKKGFLKEKKAFSPRHLALRCLARFHQLYHVTGHNVNRLMQTTGTRTCLLKNLKGTQFGGQNSKADYKEKVISVFLAWGI